MKSQILSVLQSLQSKGHQAYVVGGFVRDRLLGRPTDDVDIATSATPDQVKAVFANTIDVGIDHGSVQVILEGMHFDITTFRSDGSYSNYRQPDQVAFGSSFEADVLRRDFTINAIGMDVNGKLIDYVEGQKDLEQGLIRAIGDPYERMKEDALRIVRALRFVSVLGFTLEPTLYEAMKQHQSLVAHVSIERIQEELRRLLQGAYIAQVNNYLATMNIPYLAKEYVADSNLTFIEQCAIAQLQQQGSADAYKLTKQERKELQYLLSIPASLPDVYDLYQFQYRSSVIQVGAVVYGWNKDTLSQMSEELVITSRSDLAIRGEDVVASGYKGVNIERMLRIIERLVVTKQLANSKADIMTYLRGRNDEN